MRCESAVNRQSHAEHEARSRAAQPENRRGDLVGPPEAADRLIVLGFFADILERTPVPGLYYASSATHAGGGVCGIPGMQAAKAALADRRAGVRRK